MVVVAAAGGVAVAAAVAMLWRRERPVQLAAMGILWLALVVALFFADAALPAIVMLLAGLAAGTVSLAPLTRERGPDDRPAPRTGADLAVVVALGVVTLGILVGTGVAGRDALVGGAASPSLAAVAHAFLLRTGVPALGVVVLAAAVLTAGTAILRRDSREVQEEQAEAGRRRRLEEQRQRAQRREAAREAARAQRRGGRS